VLTDLIYSIQQTPPYFKGQQAKKIWIGNDGCITGLHYDQSPGFLCVFHGRKVVTFLPKTKFLELAPNTTSIALFPDSKVRCYTFTKIHMTHVSKIGDRLTFDSPDALKQQFPEVAEALQEKIEVELKAGEALFIPPYVWHYVQNFGSGMYLD
jgi:hypothetical protein